MYLYNIHILYYVLFCILGIVAGQLSDWCIKRMPEHKKIISKDFFHEFKPNYILMTLTVIIYLALLITNGIKNQFLSNIQLIKYTILTPMLISAFVIDYKYQIIPNRLNMTIFEVGLVATFISGLFNMNLVTNALLGMLFGGGVFLIITLIGRTCCRKRSNGIWRRQVYGSIRTLFWHHKYYRNISYGISSCGNHKRITSCNEN